MAARPAILTPSLDALCVGGLSIVLLLPLAFAEPRWVTEHFLEWTLILTAVINAPHIMGSYRLLYSSKELVRQHPWAAIRIPILLGSACIAALVLAARGVTFVPVQVIHLTGVAYLAVHYIGQTWGMMATFSHLGGVPFSADERRALVWSLRYLLLWHVCWVFAHFVPVAKDSAVVQQIYSEMTWGIPISMAVGVVTLVLHARRHRQMTPVSVLIPWLANHVWYLVLARIPAAHAAVQISHALQYLPFVARVEMNRASQRPPAEVKHKATVFAAVALVAGAVLFFGVPQWVMPGDLPFWIAVEPASAAVCSIPLAVLLVVGLRRGVGATTIHLISLAITLLVAGVFGYWWIAPAAGLVAVEFFAVDESMLRTGTTVSAFLGLHHYITDGVLWKLRNPDVRRQLFAHLPQRDA